VDSTMQFRAVVPTDARLMHRAIEKLVRLTKAGALCCDRAICESAGAWRSRSALHPRALVLHADAAGSEVPTHWLGRVAAPIRREMKRHTAIEPVIGCTKAEHRMDRNYLKDRDGDRIMVRQAHDEGHPRRHRLQLQPAATLARRGFCVSSSPRSISSPPAGNRLDQRPSGFFTDGHLAAVFWLMSGRSPAALGAFTTLYRLTDRLCRAGTGS
jgi:hypothetical protein